jgi:hypothetical protein
MNKLHLISLYKKTNSTKLSKIGLFLEQVLEGNIVPSELFREGGGERVTGLLELFEEEASRCSSIPEQNIFSEQIAIGLKKLSNSPNSKSRHRFVLTEILEHDEYSIAIEVPVWCFRLETKKGKADVTGHIDLLRYMPQSDKFEIVDYKPEGFDANKYVRAQLLLYRELLCRLVGLTREDVLLSWFTNDSMYKLREI